MSLFLWNDNLIVIEGVDGAGKTTLCKELQSRSDRLGWNLGSIKFPDKETVTGQLIYNWLQSDSSLAQSVLFTETTHQSLQLANKIEVLMSAPRNYSGLIVDRYVLSSVVYGSLKGIPLSVLNAWNAVLPRPFVTFVLDLDIEGTIARQPQKSRDRYEQDILFLTQVRDLYRQRARDAHHRLIEVKNKTVEQLADEVEELLVELDWCWPGPGLGL